MTDRPVSLQPERMRPAFGLASVLLMLLTAGGMAADHDPGLQRLRGFLESVQTMRAGFRQQLLDDHDELIESARGTVLLQRPGRFRWTYTDPYERLIVADGERVWMLDTDLEQVTVRDLGVGLGNTPAALLTGQVDVLDNFILEHSSTESGVLWVRLKPAESDSDFEWIALGFSGQRLVQLDLRDKLGQTTRVEFTDIELNPKLGSDEFEFDIPDGVDVIDESAI
jgi:outer membrane lipoprotein carrier protein